MYIKADGQYFSVFIYDIIRLQQDFESEIKEYGYFSIEPNIIIVKEVSHEQIKDTLLQLYNQNYFQQIKSIEGESLLYLQKNYRFFIE